MEWREFILFSGIAACISLVAAWLLSGRLKAWLKGRRAMPDEQESPVVHKDSDTQISREGPKRP